MSDSPFRSEDADPLSSPWTDRKTPRSPCTNPARSVRATGGKVNLIPFALSRSFMCFHFTQVSVLPLLPSDKDPLFIPSFKIISFHRFPCSCLVASPLIFSSDFRLSHLLFSCLLFPATFSRLSSRSLVLSPDTSAHLLPFVFINIKTFCVTT